MDDNPCQFKHASSVVKNQNVLTTQLLELLKVDEEERHEEGRHEEDGYKQEDRQDCRQDEEEYRQDCRQEDSNDSFSNSLHRSGTSYSDTSHSGLISSDLSDSSTYESDISEFVFKQENRCIQFSKRPISVIKQNKFVKFSKRSISGEQKNRLKTIMHEQAKRCFRLSNVEEATTEKFDNSCFQDGIPSLSTFSSSSPSSKSFIAELCSQDNRRIIFCDKPLPEE